MKEPFPFHDKPQHCLPNFFSNSFFFFFYLFFLFFDFLLTCLFPLVWISLFVIDFLLCFTCYFSFFLPLDNLFTSYSPNLFIKRVPGCSYYHIYKLLS